MTDEVQAICDEYGLPTLGRLITAKEAATLLETTPKFIRDCLNKGTIKGVKVGSIWRINRDEFLKQYGLVLGTGRQTQDKE